MIQKISDKCPKIEEKWQKVQWSILKSFDFLLLVEFFVVPMLHPEIQLRQRFWRKT